MITTEIQQAFTFLDTMSGHNNAAPKIPYNQVRIHRNNGGSSVVFSSHLGKELAMEGFKSMRVARNNYTGDLAFVFSKSSDGHQLRFRNAFRDGDSGTSRNFSVIICSKTLVDALFREFHISKDEKSATLEMSQNNSKNADVRFYTIVKI